MKLVCALLQAVGALGIVCAAGMVAAPLGVAVAATTVFAFGLYLEHR